VPSRPAREQILLRVLTANVIDNYCGCCSRKNKFPVGEVRVMKLFVPSLEMPLLSDQLTVVKSEFCCNVQPVEG
jgi:hypothetical protein